jgi:hypothetical protein
MGFLLRSTAQHRVSFVKRFQIATRMDSLGKPFDHTPFSKP